MDLVSILYNLKQQKDSGAEINKDLINFIGCCMSNVPNSYSQNFQDVWAYYEGNFKTDGYFVEFGATNGVTSSNTLMLEQLGWDGLLCEPNPAWHSDLNNNRKVAISTKCVYNKTGETVEFVQAELNELSTIKGYGLDDEHSRSRESGNVIQVETITLYDLLETNNAPENVDYLSIDTEGSEYEILKKFFDDNEKYSISNITVEHNFVSDFREKIYDLLVKNGYKRKFIGISRWDDFYTRG
jgi:FkbM family methyltransferase